MFCVRPRGDQDRQRCCVALDVCRATARARLRHCRRSSRCCIPGGAPVPFTEIAEIPEKDLHLLGYLSSAQLDVLLFLDSLAGNASDEKDFQALVEAFQPQARDLLKDAIKNRDKSDLQRLRTEIRNDAKILLERQEMAREIGRKNTQRYLSLPFIDVYVATSMRGADDFLSQQRFAKAVFEHESI
jgi:hypothetical protein